MAQAIKTAQKVSSTISRFQSEMMRPFCFGFLPGERVYHTCVSSLMNRVLPQAEILHLLLSHLPWARSPLWRRYYTLWYLEPNLHVTYTWENMDSGIQGPFCNRIYISVHAKFTGVLVTKF